MKQQYMNYQFDNKTTFYVDELFMTSGSYFAKLLYSQSIVNTGAT